MNKLASMYAYKQGRHTGHLNPGRRQPASVLGDASSDKGRSRMERVKRVRPVEASLNESGPSERKDRRNRVVKTLFGLKRGREIALKTQVWTMLRRETKDTFEHRRSAHSDEKFGTMQHR
jgi:hypothetical protein